LATAGTPKDENIKNRPKSSPQQTLEVEVASITLLNRADSEDEEELEGKELEVYQTLAVRVDRTRAEDGKWKNPTKIIKRIEPKERKLAVLKIVRLEEWKLATVTDVTDEGMEADLELAEEVVLV